MAKAYFIINNYTRLDVHVFPSLVFSRRHGYRAVLMNMLFSSADTYTMFIPA